jgi:hypothetical protein
MLRDQFRYARAHVFVHSYDNLCVDYELLVFGESEPKWERKL